MFWKKKNKAPNNLYINLYLRKIPFQMSWTERVFDSYLIE